MAKVLLGVTGSVAAMRTPLLATELTRAGHAIQVVATAAAQYFFDPGELTVPLIRDEDEWPGRGDGQRYRRDDPVLHIELRRWADVFLIAPLDANTLAKLAAGLADNCLTCVWRAWDTNRPVLLAPAMNTLMWEHPLTARHLRQLAADAGADVRQTPAELDDLVAWLNASGPRLRVIAPQSKRLACGDVGVGAMAEVPEIVEAVQHILPQTLP